MTSRKRPLLVKSTAPPPRTATTLRLEKMLEGNHPKRTKKSLVVHSNKKTRVASSVILTDKKQDDRWSNLLSDVAATSTSSRKPNQNVLSSRGGLANAPSFRKATIPVTNSSMRRKTNSNVMMPRGGQANVVKIKTPNSNGPSIRKDYINLKENKTKQPTKKDGQERDMKQTDILMTQEKRHEQTKIETLQEEETTVVSTSKMGLKLEGKRKSWNKDRRPMVGMETEIFLPNRNTSDSSSSNQPPQEMLAMTGESFTSKALPKTSDLVGKVLSTADTLQTLSTSSTIKSTGSSSGTARLGGIPNKAPPVYQRHSSAVVGDREESQSRKQKDFPNSKFSQKNESSSSSSKKNNNDNFVRLNMRNSAGSCRGARNKKRNQRRHSRRGDMYGQKDHGGYGDKEKGSSTRQQSSSGHFYASKMTGLDPLDDFVDGVFHHNNKPSAKSAGTQPQQNEVPKCARHQRPCKLVVVKKNTTGNKGRKFYACSMPRGEQCNHFQWADDTLEAARAALSDNKSNSSFISRQVAAYVDRFRMLTVPELREEAARRSLKKTGKKKELLFRLALWVRDEVAQSFKEYDEDIAEVALDVDEEDSLSSTDDDDDDDDDDDSTSSEELDFFQEDGKAEIQTIEIQQIDGTGDEGIETNSQRLKESLTSLFGHSNFRDGQEWAIKRCLNKEKSLLVAPTGFGKSLCYALPAALMEGTCVVVSPLVSLIQDQLRSLPPRIPAATLSGSLSASQTAAIVDDLIQKRIKILFVSPERLASPSFQRLFRLKWNPESKQTERSFPEISLLCIDEAHCVSQWAHNFRPCFLRFQSILSIMNPQSILAITATAGPRVIEDICQTIGIESNKVSEGNQSVAMDGIKVIERGRDNIDVACQFLSSQEERFLMLSKILTKCPDEGDQKDNKNAQYYGCLAKGSVIVYVWRQKDTEVVAEHLASSGVSGGVVVYHGGMDSHARTKSQSMFMRGKARICVATVAFGMGIDKANVVGVIHLYLSASPEHYLQEIGRAGRDGRAAKAIALPVLDEIPRRHSLEHSSIISKSQIRSLLFAIRCTVERPTDEKSSPTDQPLQVALPVKDCVLGCDCKPETIETLLSLIEQAGGNDPLLQVIGFNYDRAVIALKRRTLKKLAEKEPVVSSIQAVAECINAPVCGSETDSKLADSTQKPPDSFQKQFLAYSLGSFLFSVVDCATNLGPSAEPRHVFAALRRLQSSNELELALDTSESGRVFHIKLSKRGALFFGGSNFDSFVEDMTNKIYDRFTSSILSGAGKVLDMSYIMDEVATSCESLEIHESGKSKNLLKFQELVDSYFKGGLNERSHVISRLLPSSFSSVAMKELQADAFAVMRDLPLLATQPPEKSFVSKLSDPEFSDYTALATAKFLHGIDSPRAPLRVFRTHPLFGKWKETQFLLVLESLEQLFDAPTNK